ncbi:protein BCAP isoform X1 [Frankliniella occidentalis]|uniref:Protein BCAP isoform X1 n=1 Tax=Frankliniella occidentalis TaxID=133901 RepID=A0A9C6WZ01_FRAOC|nr:protein BCAP isoform X1 [Frankliniella occidentalis]
MTRLRTSWRRCARSSRTRRATSKATGTRYAARALVPLVQATSDSNSAQRLFAFGSLQYLMAQQQVEEQRRQMEQVEAEQDRITEQVQAELHRVKNEFEERLQELAPLPDILKATQSKMHEEKQLRLIAEHNCADLNHELATVLERLADNDKGMGALRAQQQSWMDERQSLISHVDAYERKCNKLKEDIKWYKQGMEQLEQSSANSDKLYEDTVLELGKVRGELEAAREQAARQATRQRDQVETMRRSFQTQIGELEKELAASRASASAAHKEKEEIQQRLQTEVSNMSQSFKQAQDRIKNLKSVVDFLKDSVINIEKAPNELDCLQPNN